MTESLVGRYYESKQGMHWYHSSDLFPSRFVNKGSIAEIIDEDDKQVTLKFEDSEETMKITRVELDRNFLKV